MTVYYNEAELCVINSSQSLLLKWADNMVLLIRGKACLFVDEVLSVLQSGEIRI